MNSEEAEDHLAEPWEQTIDTQEPIPLLTEPEILEISRTASRDHTTHAWLGANSSRLIGGSNTSHSQVSHSLITRNVGVSSHYVGSIPVHTVPVTSDTLDGLSALASTISAQHERAIIDPSTWLGAIPENTNSLLVLTKALVLNSSRAIYRDSLPAISAGIGNAMSWLPRQARQELQNLAPEAVILRQILFLMMNNLADEKHTAFAVLFEQIKHFSASQIESVLTAFPEPYSLALQQSVLTLAIKADARSVVSLLLDRDLQIQHWENNHNTNPLVLACKLRRVQIVQMLLRSNADFTATLKTVIGESFIMMKRPNGEEDLERESPKILELLLTASIIDTYIKFGQSVTISGDPDTSSLKRAFKNLIHIPNFKRATAAIKRMLGEHFSIGSVKDQRTAGESQTLLQLASLEGNQSLVEFLLERGAVPDTYCLCQAIRGNNEQIAERYIQEGLEISLPCRIPRLIPNAPQEDPRLYAGVLSHDVDPLLRDYLSVDYNITSPLAEAVRWNRQSFISRLEDISIADITEDSSRVVPVLLAAAEVGRSDLMHSLLKKTSLLENVQACYSLAALGGHNDIIAMLMASGIQPPQSLMTTAVAVHNLALVRLLLNLPIQGHGHHDAIFFAVRWGHIDILTDLIRAGTSLDGFLWNSSEWSVQEYYNLTSFSPLQEAIKIGNLEIARFLLRNGARINTDRYNESSPLATAVQNGYEDFVQELLHGGADPKDEEALKCAVSQPNRMYQIILEAFSRRYPHGDVDFASGALQIAIKNEDEAKVRLLGEHTNLNSQRIIGSMKTTLFSEAIRSRHINIIRILLDDGGDPNSTVPNNSNMTNYQGRWTAFLDAIATDDVAVVRLIHEAGADLNGNAEFGISRTPLQLAIERGELEIVNYLLENGADVNGAPCMWSGATALQLAAIEGNVGLAERLIEQYGADPNEPACKFQGRTAFEGAAEYGRTDMLLRLYHKKVDLISDGGVQVQRAMYFADKNGQPAAKALVEQLAQSAKDNLHLSELLPQAPIVWDV
jgi:ankyrin repeat protein